MVSLGGAVVAMSPEFPPLCAPFPRKPSAGQSRMDNFGRTSTSRSVNKSTEVVISSRRECRVHLTRARLECTRMSLEWHSANEIWWRRQQVTIYLSPNYRWADYKLHLVVALWNDINTTTAGRLCDAIDDRYWRRQLLPSTTNIHDVTRSLTALIGCASGARTLSSPVISVDSVNALYQHERTSKTTRQWIFNKVIYTSFIHRNGRNLEIRNANSES